MQFSVTTPENTIGMVFIIVQDQKEKQSDSNNCLFMSCRREWGAVLRDGILFPSHFFPLVLYISPCPRGQQANFLLLGETACPSFGPHFPFFSFNLFLNN